MTVPTDPMDRAGARITDGAEVQILDLPDEQRSSKPRRRSARKFNAAQPRDDDGKWSSNFVHEAVVDLGSLDMSLHLGLDNSGEVEVTFSDNDGSSEHVFTLDAAASADFAQLLGDAVDAHSRADFPLDDGKTAFDGGVKDVDGSPLDLWIDHVGDGVIYYEQDGEGVDLEMGIDEFTSIRDAFQEIETEADAQGMRSRNPTGGRRAVKVRKVAGTRRSAQVRERNAPTLAPAATPEGLDVVRDVLRTAEVRAAGDGADDVLGTVYGHFSVFDAWYPIRSWWEGDFVERIAPGAFAKTMKERRGSIVTAFDHGFDPQIGDKVLGPVDVLREDGTGAYYEISLLDTSYGRDLMPGLKRGLYGASFRFAVVKDEWNQEPDKSDHNPDAMPERTIRELRLYEFGPVTYPASPAATSAMRSGTDTYYERLARRDPDRVGALRSQIRDLRTSAARPAPEAAPQDLDEPRTAHSAGLSPRERREALYPTLKGEQR